MKGFIRFFCKLSIVIYSISFFVLMIYFIANNVTFSSYFFLFLSLPYVIINYLIMMKFADIIDDVDQLCSKYNRLQQHLDTIDNELKSIENKANIEPIINEEPCDSLVKTENDSSEDKKIAYVDIVEDLITCPNCGLKQPSNRKHCFHCETIFLKK